MADSNLKIQIKLISWKQFEKRIVEVVNGLPKKKFRKLVCITSGGLIASYYFSKILGIHNIETFNARSYQNKNRGKLYTYGKIKPDKGRDILLVDDLIDSGETIKFAKQYYPNAQVAVLYENNKHKKTAEWIVFPYEKTFNF